jgi:homoserine kinase type II
VTISTSAIRRCIAAEWGLAGAEVAPHHGGMNSETWFVRTGLDRYVAKAVPPNAHRRFVSGLSVAAMVQAAGIPSGAAVPMRDGRPFTQVEGQTMALLTFVNGSGLVGWEQAEQRLMGSTLARVHAALIGREVPGADRFHWLNPEAAHLAIRDWVRPAIAGALEEWESLPPASLTWGLLHTDPAPEAFLFDGDTGICGLIDWDTGMEGPLMYDVASAVMYVGGPGNAGALIDAYLEQDVLDRAEVERTLRPMLRLRWAVQADYFARRLSTDDLTGIGSADENELGLEDARMGLGGPIN